ncbi:MAG: hypothetical protein V5A84_04680, partial [Planctomycetota bacterium]
MMAGAGDAASPRGGWKKGLVVDDASRATLESLREAGFEGVETRAADVSPGSAADARGTAEELGIRIHSVMRGWMNFNSRDEGEV